MNNTMYVDYTKKSCQNTKKGNKKKNDVNPEISFMEQVAKKMAQSANMVGAERRKSERSFWKKREERRRKLRRQYAQVQAKRAMWKRVLESEKARTIHENKMIARRESENGNLQQTGYVRTELSQAYAAYEAYAVASIAVSKMR